jgi:GDP-4-dehydro-6-deoxy-D-mannose reductase
LNIFITGAAGFVGCYLRKFLHSQEHSIWGSAYPHVPEDNSGDRLFYLDLRSTNDVRMRVQEMRPDWVFHLAAISNVRHSWSRRKETLETNIIGTLNLLDAIREFSPEARILYVSSSDIYGRESRTGVPLTEEEEVLAMNPYAYSKCCGELLSQFYTRVENLDIVIARSFPHTGPGQSADFVCSDWANQIARIEKGRSDPVIEVGNIAVERDFTDVRDVVCAYALLIEKGKRGEVYNVCSNRSWSLQSILECLLSFTEKDISVRVDSQRLRKADIPRLVGDNKKIKEAVAWEPRIPLEQSLEELLEYWRQHI